jgi:hypothetical protein
MDAMLSPSVPFFLLPDEIIEIILLEEYNNHLITDRCDMSFSFFLKIYSRKIQLFSTICRRFRQILLPKIYRNISVTPTRKSDLSRVPHFFPLTSFYGHFCQELRLRIPETGARFCNLTDSLRQHSKYLINLRVLSIRLYHEALPGRRKIQFLCHHLMEVPDLSPEELCHWQDLCTALPRVTKFDLYGFTWSDAVAGFSRAHLPTIQMLQMHLAAPTPTLTLSTARALNSTFSGLVDITLLACWCPDTTWVRTAFANRRLQNITVDHSTDCLCLSNNRGASLELLLELNAHSLTSLTITTNICFELSPERAALPCLTSLILRDVNFDNNEEKLLFIMAPFLGSPLQHLGLGRCWQVPESFCTWFDPELNRWSELETLSLDSQLTTCGPGDAIWDKADPEERSKWDGPDDHDIYWRSRGRIALEDYCKQRGIQITSNWCWLGQHN